jgi:hypothetical protein
VEMQWKLSAEQTITTVARIYIHMPKLASGQFDEVRDCELKCGVPLHVGRLIEDQSSPNLALSRLGSRVM